MNDNYHRIALYFTNKTSYPTYIHLSQTLFQYNEK